MTGGDREDASSYTGTGIALGGGLGLLAGVFLGGSAIALGLAFGAGVGLVIGASVDAAKRD